MAKDNVLIKEEILEDEQDLDCFGNFDKKEINTCLKCGLKNECKQVTAKIKNDNSLNIRPLIKDSLKIGKKKIKDTNEVVKLINLVKTKQQEVEKNMSDEKLVKKVKKVEKVEKSDKVDKPTKLVKKVAKTEDGEKKGKGRPKTKEDVEVLSGSTVPVAFKTLWKEVKSLGDVVTKTSVTNIKGPSGIMFCFPTTGRKSNKIDVFLNRSEGYAISGKHVEVKETKKGPFVLAISDNKKSQEEGATLLKKWASDYEKHVASNGGGKKKPKKSDDDKPSKTKKLVKKSDDDSGKKLVKNSDKDEKKVSKKASPPIVKPIKKVEVEDDEG